MSKKNQSCLVCEKVPIRTLDTISDWWTILKKMVPMRILRSAIMTYALVIFATLLAAPAVVSFHQTGTRTKRKQVGIQSILKSCTLAKIKATCGSRCKSIFRTWNRFTGQAANLLSWKNTGRFLTN